MRKLPLILIGCMSLGLAGCENPGEKYRADSFTPEELSRPHQTEIVTLLSVTPAKVRVSNAHNKKMATVLGGILGAGAGLGAAKGGGVGNLGTAGAGIGGAGAGALIGSAVVKDYKMVPGVMLAYKSKASSELQTTEEVGRVCEYAAGQPAMLIKFPESPARIQPNAQCPDGSKGHRHD